MSQEGNKDDMIGFKDFLESQEEKRGVQSGSKKNYATHELLSFFEKENKRLDRLIKLYTQKASMINNYSQEESLIIELRSKVIDEKSKLLAEIKKPESHLNKNLADIFRIHFTSLKKS